MSYTTKYGTNGNMGYNPFTLQYLSQARAIAKQQGFTAGENEGYGADDSTQFAPPILSVPPNDVKTLYRQEVYGTTDFVDTPFYPNEVVPPQGGVEFISEQTNATTLPQLTEKTKNNLVPIIIVLGLLFFIFGR